MTPPSNADDEVTTDIEETVKVRTTFREKMRNLSGFLLEQVKPLLAGVYGWVTIVALCLTIFLSVAAANTPGMSWWLPWVWFIAGGVLTLLVMRAALVIKVAIMLTVTAYCALGMRDIAFMADPYSQFYLTAGISPLIALLLYWVATQFGVYGASRWTAAPVFMLVSTLVGQVTIAATLSPLYGSLAQMGFFLAVSLLWYRYSSRLRYSKEDMPAFVSLERFKESVNADADKHPDWLYKPQYTKKKGKASSVLIVGERAYKIFPVQFNSSLVMETSPNLFMQLVSKITGKISLNGVSRLTYQGKNIENWLYQQVIANTPAGVVPILMDTTNAICKNGKPHRIELSLPDTTRRVDGSPSKYLHIGIISGSELNQTKSKLPPLVQRAEELYSRQPALSKRTKKNLRKK